MIELKETSPCAGLLPLEIGSTRLSEVPWEEMTLVAPYRGKAAAAGKALGMGWPEPNCMIMAGGARLVWFGFEEAMLIGKPAPDTFDSLAALSDQSDAWARVQLEGVGARDVLARLTPLDLRDAAFPVGGAQRSELFHMPAAFLRRAEESWEIMVFRSMAGTLVHDLKVAMEGVAARG